MLKNFVSLITGGTSALGFGTAHRFVRRGGLVILSDLPGMGGEERAKELGENVHFVPADVTSESDVENLVKEVEKKFGALHVVVNCAGLTAKPQPIYDFAQNRPLSLEDLQQVLQTNVIGTYNLARLTVSLIKKNELNEADGVRGIIINTANIQSIRSGKNQVLNAAASGAITTMTKHLAKDFTTEAIRVVTIVPDCIRSEDDKTGATISQRYGDPDEFAFMVQNIVLNSHLNGAVIELTGHQELALNRVA